MRIGLCDDEPAILDTLGELISAYGAAKGTSFELRRFLKGDELLSAIQRGEGFDLLFLDVFIGDANGMDLAKAIRRAGADCGIVFVTNSRDHALMGYQVHALQYMIKPIDPAELESALDYALSTMQPKPDRSVQVRNKQGIYRILLGDIVYAESDLRLVMIHTRDQGCISYYDRLDNFERLLEDPRFLRCHKSYLANLDFVRGIENGRVIMESGAELRISMRVSDAMAIFAEHKADTVFAVRGKPPAKQ